MCVCVCLCVCVCVCVCVCARTQVCTFMDMYDLCEKKEPKVSASCTSPCVCVCVWRGRVCVCKDTVGRCVAGNNASA